MLESRIYFHQAVTMLLLKTDSERERWLDWVLSQILDPGFDLTTLSLDFRRKLFSILSDSLLQELPTVIGTEYTEANYALSYLSKGRGYAIISSLNQLPGPTRGESCLELCLQLLSLFDRVMKCTTDIIEKVNKFDQADPSPVFGGEDLTISKRQRSLWRKHRRKNVVCAFPEVSQAGHAGEVENLVDYETLSESDDSDEDCCPPEAIQINHINYFAYFENGDIESEAVVGACKVAPPPSFTNFLRLDPRRRRTGDDVASAPCPGRLLSDVLRLAASVLAGDWSLVENVKKDQLLRILSASVKLIKDDSQDDYLTLLKIRVALNCLEKIKFSPQPLEILGKQGVEDLWFIMEDDKCVGLRQWPSICREVIQVFQQISRAHSSPHLEFRTNLEISNHSTTFFEFSKRIVQAIFEKRTTLDLSNGEIVKLIASILNLQSDSNVDTRRLWSELALTILSISVDIKNRANKVHVINSLAEFASRRKLTPSTYFHQVGRLNEFCDDGLAVTEAYLIMLERTIENLTDSWDEEVTEENTSTDLRALHRSRNSSADEGNQTRVTDGFSSYLKVLLSSDSASKELVISHLDSIICTLRSELRLQLATEVILPYLTATLENLDEDRNVLVSVLDLLCTLVKEQPTAMALIREQRAWTCVKRFGSAGGELSNVCQQIIKTLILNSHKFKKIRLSEAEAMALQDDENDRINFDERDRNAQYWLFKQLYHVLVQSSNSVLVSGWPSSMNHLTNAWQVTLELVRRVPEFFLFAVERGITDINIRLTESLLDEKSLELNKESADLLGSLVNFLVYVIVNFDLMNEEILHTNINQTKETLKDVVFTGIKDIIHSKGNVNFCRVLLSSLLESSYVTELVTREGERLDSRRDDCAESGYEADDSESTEMFRDHSKRSASHRITFADSFNFFVDSFLEMFNLFREEPEFIYTVEYLMFKLLNNCGKSRENANLFNRELALTRLYAALFSLLETDHRLDNLSEMILELTGHIAQVKLLPSTMRTIFQLIGHANRLQEKTILYFSRIIKECCSRQEYPGIVVFQNINRLRAVSASSSDSGLDSANSSTAVSPIPSSDGHQSRTVTFHDDLGQDYAIVLRIKLSPEIKKDCWLTIVTIENQNETIGLHINVKKGLKLTLANSVETIAAAETTFKSMLFPDEWIHLAFNLGSIAEGKRETKTLTAFVNCQKVWGVGLCVDKVQSKVRKKEVAVTVGPLDPFSDLCHSSLIYSDIHLLKNCILSQENVLLNYVCGPRDFNGAYSTDEICFDEIWKYLPDLLHSCLKVVSEPKVIKQHFDFARNVVAHFSPFSFWKKTSSVYEEAGMDCWTLLSGLQKSGGAESIAMIALECVEKQFPVNTVSEVFGNCLRVLCANQSVYDEFKSIGGFSLFGSILSSKEVSPNVSLLEKLLNSSSVDSGPDKILFYPQLVEVGLQYLERLEGISMMNGMSLILNFFSKLLSDTNHALDLNLQMLRNYKIFDSLLGCLQSFEESCEGPLPIEDISKLLSALPQTPEFLVKMMNLVLSTLQPYLLYLPYLSRSLLHVTVVKEKKNPYLINKVHTSDVVDVSSAMVNPHDGSQVTESTTEPTKEDGQIMLEGLSRSRSDDAVDLEIYEMEEDKVTEWEVLTRGHSTSRPATPNAYAGRLLPGNLAAIFLHKILSGFTILSDTESTSLAETDYLPETFLPLVGHPNTDVHASSLDLIGLILERSSLSKKKLFDDNGGYYQLAALIQDSAPSPQLLSSALSLLHGHPIDVNIPFEFNKTSPPQLNLSAVCLLPPLIVSSVSCLSLGHNLLCHIHELMANSPEFTKAMMSEHLLQTLLAGLVRLGDLPEIESDIFGCNESELLTEDIYNILRMLIVFFADQPGEEYEDLLDILFLASGLLKPVGYGEGKPNLGTLSSGSTNSLRSAVCLILEEILLTLETGLLRTGERPSEPRYFHKEDFPDIDQDNAVFKYAKGRQASNSVLVSRLNQISKFSVNYLTSGNVKLINEEESLALSIFQFCWDVTSNRCPANSPLNGLHDAKSLGGVLILLLLKFGSERKKISLIKMLDARNDVVSILEVMFPETSLREHLRHCVLNTMKSSQIFCSSDDAKLVTLFYGRVLTKVLFPSGPDNSFSQEFPVTHSSYEPWKAECIRCVSLFLAQVNQDSKKKAAIAAKFTEKCVERHDFSRKYFLERGRDKISSRQRSLRSWKRIIGNQTHPLALWHDPKFEPQSLVLENITGLSGTYIRFRRSHSGIRKEKFYKEGFKYKSEEEKFRYAFLLGDKDSQENLSSKLDYPEQIQRVESVMEVTPTDVLDCDLVVSQDTMHVFSSCSWNSEISQIESFSMRRYQLKNIALEFFLRSGENHLMVFKSQEIRENFIKFMVENGVCLNPKNDYLHSLTKKWKQGVLSNFKYLSELNSLAGRTPNDLMQYPVFPWILADYTSDHLNLTEPSAFRNLRRPIAIQDENNKEKYETIYRLLNQEGTGLPSHMGPYHYASHYSNTGIVLHLMVRIPPFTGEFIKFQDGNFDLADRSFHSLGTSWQMVSHVSTSDVKELIPQLFYLPEMFENNEGYALGKRQNGKDVDSVELPMWAPDARIFVKIHRQALESAIVKQEISHWIDLVFGYKQRGSAAVEAVNVFHPATYAHNLDQTEDDLERRARQTMIATYGQTPLQLFTAPHPLGDIELSTEKSNQTPVYRTVSGLKWGNYVGSPAYPPPYVVWQQAQTYQVKTLLRFDSNQVVGLSSNTVLVDGLNQENSDGSFLLAGQASANVISWGHGDGALYCKQGKHGEATQVALLPLNDSVVIGATNPKVSTLWLGHKSGRISVYHYWQKSAKSKLSLDYVSTLYGHMSLVTSIVVSPDYSLAVSASSNGYVITWDLHSQSCLHSTAVDCRRTDGSPATYDSEANVLTAISESCGDIVVAANSTLTLYTVNLSKVCQTTIRGTITAVTFSHLEEGKAVNSILIGTQSGGVRLYSSWDLTHIRDVVGCPSSPVTSLCFSLDCLSLVVSTKNCFITIFEKSGSHGLNKTPKYISL